MECREFACGVVLIRSSSETASLRILATHPKTNTSKFCCKARRDIERAQLKLDERKEELKLQREREQLYKR